MELTNVYYFRIDCSGRVDLVIVMDASGSIHAERFIKVKKFTQALVDKLEISSDKARVSLITWGDNAHMEVSKTTLLLFIY